METGIQTADWAPSHRQVLLATGILILGNKARTIAAPAQLWQPAQQQLAKPTPAKLFRRGGAAGGAQGSAHTACLYWQPPWETSSPAKKDHPEFTGDCSLMLHSIFYLWRTSLTHGKNFKEVPEPFSQGEACLSSFTACVFQSPGTTNQTQRASSSQGKPRRNWNTPRCLRQTPLN